MCWNDEFENLVARTDDAAFLDSLYGLVPVDVLVVTDKTIRVRVHWSGCTHPLRVGPSPFGDGETVEEYRHKDIVPKRALVRVRDAAFAYIRPYRWEVSS